MAGPINIGGLASKQQWKPMIDQLMAVRQARINQLQARQDMEASKQQAIGQLNSNLLSLRTAVQALASTDSFSAQSVSLTSSSAVPAANLLSVTATPAAVAGQHSLVVQSLAQAQRQSSSANVLTSTGSPALSGQTPLGLVGTFQVNGQTISVQASDNLQAIASSIQTSSAAVDASIVQVAPGDYRLFLASQKSGAASLSVTGADLTGALANLQLAAGGTIVQVGRDAQFTLDGMQITRPSNTISDVLSGVSFQLKQADVNSNIQMTIQSDTVAIKAKVQAFIDAYNATASFINQQYTFDPVTKTAGLLASESILGSVQMSLSSSVLQTVSGIPSDRNSLALLGIELNAKGQMQMNAPVFDAWLASAPASVSAVFAAAGSSSNQNLSFLLAGPSNTSGSYAVNISQAATQATALGKTAIAATGLAAAGTISISDAAGQQASLNVSAGQSLASVVAGLNAAFASSTSKSVGTVNTLTTAAGAPATANTTFAALGLGIAAGDTIRIQGVDRAGNAVSGQYQILNPAIDSLNGLLDAIRFHFKQQLTPSIDAQGHIVVSDIQTGQSQMSLSLTAQNEGGGSLQLGATQLLTAGRSAMRLSAVALGSQLQIQSQLFGASQSIQIQQSSDLFGFGLNSSYAGKDVAGSIAGQAATAFGQTLMANSGVASGLALQYTGAATGAIGSMQVSIGLGAQMANTLDLLANPFTGLLNGSILASEGIAKNYADRILQMQDKMLSERDRLTRQFANMETTVSKLNTTSQWMSNQMGLSTRRSA